MLPLRCWITRLGGCIYWKRWRPVDEDMGKNLVAAASREIYLGVLDKAENLYKKACLDIVGISDSGRWSHHQMDLTELNCSMDFTGHVHVWPCQTPVAMPPWNFHQSMGSAKSKLAASMGHRLLASNRHQLISLWRSRQETASKVKLPARVAIHMICWHHFQWPGTKLQDHPRSRYHRNRGLNRHLLWSTSEWTWHLTHFILPTSSINQVRLIFPTCWRGQHSFPCCYHLCVLILNSEFQTYLSRQLVILSCLARKVEKSCRFLSHMIFPGIFESVVDYTTEALQLDVDIKLSKICSDRLSQPQSLRRPLVG